MNIPGFTAECSLYKSTRSCAAHNHVEVEDGTVIPAQQLMDLLSTGSTQILESGVVFSMKKICWDQRSSETKFAGLTFRTDCQICQWFKQARICPRPPACELGWVPVGDPMDECDSKLVAIE
jgi:hypothetical protein